MLISFWYWSRRDVRAQLDHLVPEGVTLELFADSGAFSAFTLRGSGGAIKREDYAAWLTTWKPLLRVMVNLDVIGDAKASARNQLWFEGRGLSVLPVYHMQSPLAELGALCRDYDYIAIGGTASLRGQAKLQATARAMRVARDHGTRVHGLGRSASDELLALPFYSVDSTAWMQGSRFGSLQLFTGQRVKAMPVKEAVKHPQLLRQHGADPQAMAHPWYGNLGKAAGLNRNREDYRRENDESAFVAATAWKRMETYLRQRHDVPAPPGHETNGTVVWFANDNLLHQEQMMRAVQRLTRAGLTARRCGRVSDEAVRAHAFHRARSRPGNRAASGRTGPRGGDAEAPRPDPEAVGCGPPSRRADGQGAEGPAGNRAGVGGTLRPG
jgi:hypothetical protein